MLGALENDAFLLNEDLFPPLPPQPEQSARVFCSASLCLYANIHFSINLAVLSEAFDTGLAFCEVIHPEFL